ncbi:alcohol dehydrogenase catalytic domain-containing protein [Streptomyces sp. NPDC048172]|uniref:alcohol dehydrogenase catalytic domain-containing protein n=1 Tax=Streptomyces sp. NPDC048172 TaxID=3365505 RepID=UPI00371148B6
MITEVVLPGAVGPAGPVGSVGPAEPLLRTRPVPPLLAGQALVRMEAAGISYAEQQMCRGAYRDQPPFPFVPGFDAVGVIDTLAGGSPRFAVGQRVAALTGTGAWADRLVLATDDLVAVPDGLHATDAETVIADGVTARRMLAAAPVGDGDTVVVLGAADDVGSLLVQLARHAGAQVVGVAAAYHLPYVREIGAIPLDRDTDLAAGIRRVAPRGAVAVFDHAADGPGPGPGAGSVGRGAASAGLWPGRERNPRDSRSHRAELHADLRAVFGHLAAGEITARIARAFPLSQIAEALRYAGSGAAAGKVVLLPDTD